jgi:hypothetical protein
MNKTTLLAVASALGGTVLGIGITVALYPAAPVPTEIQSATTSKTGKAMSGTSDSSLLTEHAVATKAPPTTPGKAPASGTGVALTDAVAALRKAGVSDMMMAEFIAAQAAVQRKERQRDLMAKIARGEADPNTVYVGANVERDQMIRSLLGDEAFQQWDKQNYVDRVVALRLSPEEYDAWYMAQKEQEARTLEISQRHMAGEVDVSENSAQLRALVDEADRRMKELLGPERYAQYKAGMYGGAGNSARWYLRDLKLGDSQFDALAQADASFAQKNAELMERQRTGFRTGDYFKEVQAIQAARDAEYERVLGPQGMAEWQKQQDSQYKQMIKYATAWQLSKADADFVYEAQRQYRQAVQDAAKNPAGYAARAEELRTLGEQAAQNVQNYLGADRYAKLKKAGAINLPTSK